MLSVQFPPIGPGLNVLKLIILNNPFDSLAYAVSGLEQGWYHTSI